MENLHDVIKDKIDNMMREHLKKLGISTLDALLSVSYAHILAVVSIEKSGIDFEKSIKENVKYGDANYIMYIAAEICKPLILTNKSIINGEKNG